MRRRLAVTIGAIGIALLVVSSPGAGTAHAQASPQHRAAVIIDTGSAVKHVCILFNGDSISGKAALDLANQADPSIQPVYRDYGSLGAAVCSLCGTGNPQSDCLGQQSGKYWAYDRAPRGTTTFTQSSEGISTTQVHDGDVEGWHWGTGGAPPYASVEQVCGTLGTDGTFTPTSVTTYAAPAPPTGVPRTPNPPPQQVRPPAGATTTTSAPPEPTTTATTTETGALTQGSGPSGTALAQLPKHGGGSGGGGSMAGLVGFGVVAAGLGGWFWWLRHARIARGV